MQAASSDVERTRRNFEQQPKVYENEKTVNSAEDTFTSAVQSEDADVERPMDTSQESTSEEPESMRKQGKVIENLRKHEEECMKKR